MWKYFLEQTPEVINSSYTKISFVYADAASETTHVGANYYIILQYYTLLRYF